jgi:hypothetical protein
MPEHGAIAKPLAMLICEYFLGILVNNSDKIEFWANIMQIPVHYF